MLNSGVVVCFGTTIRLALWSEKTSEVWLSFRSDDRESEYASRTYFILGNKNRIVITQRSILYLKISIVANDGEFYTLGGLESTFGRFIQGNSAERHY